MYSKLDLFGLQQQEELHIRGFKEHAGKKELGGDYIGLEHVQGDSRRVYGKQWSVLDWMLSGSRRDSVIGNFEP